MSRRGFLSAIAGVMVLPFAKRPVPDAAVVSIWDYPYEFVTADNEHLFRLDSGELDQDVFA